VHLSIGQEAIAVGVCEALKVSDKVYSTHRCHAHYLAKGGDLKRMMAEIYGKEAGCIGGRGGSMHLTDPAKGMMASIPIVSSSIPIAVGSALADKRMGTGKVTVAFFGDASIEEGVFHESANFASLHSLPVIFVCENNLYMEYTPISDVTAVPQPAADRASAYGLERIVIDGNDADVVYRTAQTAFEKARAGAGPSLIECLTYRHSGHSRADPAKYRPEGELDRWKLRDPIKIYRERLLQFGVSEKTIGEIDADVRKMVDDATEVCKAAPPPPLDIIATDVYADGGWAWRN
jgi:pyruvate dehydrogenase E1 component alpha subunit